MHGDVEREMRDAIALHLDGLPETSQPIPEPSELTTASVKVTG
jgi:predicted RNase H-like HicB family nuclease